MKTVRSILASLLNDDMTWRNEDKSRALVSQAESETRAIVRAELVEEFSNKLKHELFAVKEYDYYTGIGHDFVMAIDKVVSELRGK
jgi:hypothetical protein